MYGAALGAGVVNYAKTTLTGAFPEIWLFALGGLFIGITLFMPKGIIGSLNGIIGKGRMVAGARKRAAEE